MATMRGHVADAFFFGICAMNAVYKSETDEGLPIVVIGSGPVGLRVAGKIIESDPDTNIILYGDEPWDPYNRVRLSSYLAGETNLFDLQINIDNKKIVKRFNCRVDKIDRENKTVTDANGIVQGYSKLVIATGSQAHVPDIKGIERTGVYTFRNMTDATSLLARSKETKKVIVLGGGVLGLEIAKAVSRFNAEVLVIDHNEHVMFRQLDSTAASYLHNHLSAHNINFMLSERITEVIGDPTLTAVRLSDGHILECDTLVLATGIRSNTQLALAAGLNVGRGINVNDKLQTSDPDIYAVGECAEHNDTVYGLVNPGFEQAAVAAHTITGKPASYTGSVQVTNLKVVGETVFSLGRVGEAAATHRLGEKTYEDTVSGIYRKIIVHRDRIVGVIAIGPWAELGRIQKTILYKKRVWPWQIARFKKSGELWPGNDDIAQWPAATTVCNCIGVSRGAISQHISAGCKTVEDVSCKTGASTVCGSCRPLIVQLLGSTEKPKPSLGYKLLAIAAFFAFVFALFSINSPVVSYAKTVQVPWQWDMLWRESLFKQISGFTLLGLTILALLLSIRKRIKVIKIGDFAIWRILHALLGAVTLLVLVAHTGFRLGNNINMLLMLSFVGLIIIGSMAAGVIAFEHKISMALARKLRNQSIWLHILLFWPLPALLAFHIIKTYYF